MSVSTQQIQCCSVNSHISVSVLIQKLIFMWKLWITCWHCHNDIKNIWVQWFVKKVSLYQWKIVKEVSCIHVLISLTLHLTCWFDSYVLADKLISIMNELRTEILNLSVVMIWSNGSRPDPISMSWDSCLSLCHTSIIRGTLSRNHHTLLRWSST